MFPDLSLLYLAIFASVALAAWAIGSMVSDWGSVEQRQIRKLSNTRAEAIATLQLTDTDAAWVKRFQQVVPKSPKEMSALRRRLATAGYRDGVTAVLYGLAETGLPIVCGVAAFLQFGTAKWYLVIFAAVMGFVAPSLW